MISRLPGAAAGVSKSGRGAAGWRGGGGGVAERGQLRDPAVPGAAAGEGTVHRRGRWESAIFQYIVSIFTYITLGVHGRGASQK